MVIKPFQDLLIASLDRILAFNGISLKLAFRTLQPLEFTDVENAQNEEQVAEETGTMLSSQGDKIAQALIDLGEDENPNWILIDEYEVNYDTDETENELLSKEPKQSLLSKVVNLVSTGDPRPNLRSGQDAVIDGIKFLTRYVYAGETGGKSGKTRPFCSAMMSANKVYRKEDIKKMGSQSVNAGFGIDGGPTYSIWFYKGGPNCYHRWNKRVYATFEGQAIDINTAKQIAGRKAEKLGYVVKNPSLVSQRMIDREDRGYYRK
jgi:hypothetical protein